VIIKKGEHGAILFTPTSVFFAPGYPLEEVFDPTGAGDAFAGGFMGALAQSGRPGRRRPAPRGDLRLGDGLVRGRALLGGALPRPDDSTRSRTACGSSAR
jgi:sugar/nucleoside kinase (ribokinase family)